MVVISPGFFSDTYFLDRYWQADYWCEFGLFVPVEEVINLKSYINISENIDSDINITIDDESTILCSISKFSETNSEIIITKYSELIK